MLPVMAFRNVWRNKRRTWITVASVMFAVFFASVMRCLQDGAWEYLVSNVVGFHTGYLQIQSTDYHEFKSLDNSFLQNQVFEQIDTNQFPQVIAPRIENFGLATHEGESKAVFIIGIDPFKEKQITDGEKRIIEGHYIQKINQIILASGVAEILTASIGDSVILLSQGKTGSSTFGMFTVSGIVEFGSPELNNQMLFMGIKDANAFFRMKGHVTSLAVEAEDEENMLQIQSIINSKLDTPLVAFNYQQLLPEIMQAKEFDKLSGAVVLGVLYLLIGFGIFGTILMMLKEREYEFGILKAIGWKSGQLYLVILIECVIIALIGALLGMILSAPIVYYFEVNPIRFTGDYAKVYESFGLEALLPFKLDWSILFKQAVVVTCITILLSSYSMYKIYTLQPLKAMRR